MLQSPKTAIILNIAIDYYFYGVDYSEFENLQHPLFEGYWMIKEPHLPELLFVPEHLPVPLFVPPQLPVQLLVPEQNPESLLETSHLLVWLLGATPTFSSPPPITTNPSSLFSSSSNIWRGRAINLLFGFMLITFKFWIVNAFINCKAKSFV